MNLAQDLRKYNTSAGPSVFSSVKDTENFYKHNLNISINSLQIWAQLFKALLA